MADFIAIDEINNQQELLSAYWDLKLNGANSFIYKDNPSNMIGKLKDSDFSNDPNISSLLNNYNF